MAYMSVEEWRKQKAAGNTQGTGKSSASAKSSTISSSSKGVSGNSSGYMSVAEWRAKREKKSVQQWSEAVNALLNETQQHYGSWKSKDDIQYTQYQDRATALLAQADSWRKQYSGDTETISTIDSIVQALSDLKNYAYKSRDYYANWDTEEDYQTALRAYGYQKKYEGKSYDELESILGKLEDGEERDWLSSFAPTTMTAGDYDNRIQRNSLKLQDLQDAADEIRKVADMLNTGGENPADKKRYDQLIAKYGNLSELDRQIEALKAENWGYQNSKKYNHLDKNADFRSKSKVTANGATAGFGIGFGTSWFGAGDPVYDYINDLDGTRKKHMTATAMKGGSPYSIYDEMEEDEILKYNYLYNTEGDSAAKEYLDYLEYTLNQRRMGVAQENAKMFADKAPFLSSAISVPMNLMSGIGALDVAGQNIVKDMRERATEAYAGPVDYNRSTMAPTVVSSTIRGTVSQNIADSTGTIHLDDQEHPILSRVLNGKSLGDVYQLGMSMADSAAVAMMAPAIGSAGTVLLGGSAASQGILDAVANGATDEQALMMGILNGAFEMLFEKVSLENLLKGDTRSIVKAFFQQGFVEGTEELNTTLANNIADILVMAEKSGYRKNIAAYMEQGLSEEEATKQALWDMAIQMGWDFVGGMASGGIMGSISTPIMNAKQQNAEAKAIYGTDPGALISESLEIDPDNTFAQRMQGRLDAGKELSGRQLNRLVQQNEKALTAQDMSTIQSAAEARLTELGETGNVSTVAAALAKQAAGKNLSKSERQLISSSKYAQRVANELNAENIRSGEYSSAWAERLDTQRINPEEYSRLVEAAQQPQNAANHVGEQVVTQAKKPAVTAQAEPVETTAANGQQMASKLTTEETSATGKDILQVVEESPEAQEVEAEKPVTLEGASAKYGAQAKAMIHTYQAGQDVAKYDKAYRAAYDMGRSGVSVSYAMKSESTSYLTDSQKELAYNTGKDAADAKAKAKDAANKAAVNGKTGWKKGGVVRGEGVTIADLKKVFNDPRGKAYKILSTYAKATGVNIVLYKSQTDAEGNFIGEQGKFDPDNPNEIRIDIYAGLENISEVEDLERYVLLRTFTHEFNHFIEKWNPIRYNEFRKAVFDELTKRGKDVNELIELKMKKTGLGYEAASREVVADAMTDILPDSSFVQQLAEKHQTIFQKLLEKLKEFVQNLRAYFDSIVGNDDYAANALKDQIGDTMKYMDSIVQMWDQIAVEAVENYQATVATEEVAISEKENTTTVSETKTETKQPVTETDAYGFTISDNVEHGSLEISFESKPSEEIRHVLKENKFRWHKVKKVWFGYTDRQTIIDALHAAYEAESKAETTDTQDDQEKIPLPAETTPTVESVDPNDPYVRLAGLMGRRARFEHGNFIYRVQKAGPDNSMWQGRIDAADVSVGGVYITNAKGIHYASELYQTRDDALADIIVTARNSKLLDENTTENTKLREEVKNNGITENGTDTPAVHEPVRGSEGPARLLEGVEPETVQGSDDRRQPVQSGSDQGTGDAGRDRRVDAEGAVPERGTRDRVGGDLQQLPTVTETVTDNNVGDKTAEDTNVPGKSGTMNTHAAAKQYAADKGYRIEINKQAAKKQMVQVDIYDKQNLPTFNPVIINEASDWNKVKEAIDKREAADKAKAEQLHEEVVHQIEQKSTENPNGSNFVIGDSLNLPSGKKARTRANIEAIKLVKQIAAEGRIATAAEQEILSKYVGWGGLADAFGKPYSNKETRRIEYEVVEGLEEEFEELKRVLTEEEYKSARESTRNAHYTSIEVIKAMYDGLKQLGFTGGRMLEPSSGVGNFVGAMPADMTAQVKSWTMVELDNITGLFAKYLYPNADVRIQGFEEANIPDGYMDVAIGNVPFGKYAITDKHYPKAVTSAIHNYFFAKSLDKVRTGGIVMFITSAYTMNASDSAVRKYIMQRADLLGAIRLPNTAFAANAGTPVVTDILILKKRAERTEYAGEAFEASNWERVSNYGWDGAYINEYFTAHPEMVLGTPKLTRGMHSANELTYDPFTDRGSLGDQIREAMKHVKGKMDYSTGLSAEKANFRQASAKKKRQKLQVKDGVIQAKDENGNVTKVDVDKDTAARIAGMVAIRDAHVALCDALQQGVNKKESNSLRKALNKAYDSFVEKYGYLNSPKNKKAINAFADRYAILSLENYRTEGRKVIAEKSDIFTKDTIAANRTASSAENVEEGLTISLNTVGVVDVAMIARLTGQKADSVTRQLIDQRLVFKDRDGNLIPAAQYLSGNVRAKLREMEGLTGIDKDYQNNVEALREVVPPTVAHTDIYVNPGANWIPVSVYEDFVGYILKRQNYTAYRTGKKDFSVEYVSETNEYKVSINDSYAKMSAQNTQVWGESGKAFNTIFENMLNGRRTNVYRDNGDGTRVLDKAKTEAVAEKVEKLNEEFRKWLWEDEARRGEMQELYNETYNALVTPKYSGASLTVNGLNSTYDLRPHQKDAVARIINSGGNTLLAHRVGAGKTMEMAAAAMKLKQLGVIKKPMFVVPNNVVAQWGKEFRDYFPAANILVVGDEDMTPAERMTTINRIKNNDYDAVILAYTKFEKIQMTASWRQKFYEEQIDSIMFAINAEKESQGGKGFSVKQLETKRKQLEAKLKKLTDKAKDEDGAMFEDLGVDSLFVDEAHNFKNLEYSTRMSNVSGLGKADGAQRSFDLYTKVRYLQQLNGGRGVVFATATPVMNSMTEMYIMQKYLQPDTLKQLGIEHFDSWAKMFGEVVNALEIAPSGSGYRLKQTFSKFKNVKALQQLFRSFTDVLTDVPGLKIPKMKGRNVQIVECEQSEFQKNYMSELAKRAENVKNVDPSEDNMLKITSDGRKISYSQRMIDPSLPYEETGKIYKCCENVYAVYQESNKTKGTQMIFCDMATPKGKSSSKTDSDTNADEFASVDVESAQLYDDMKSRLVQMGIPAKEIAFIHDAKNDKQKAELSEKMNNGTIRVLIGSTGKMGVGLNAQKKAVAIHHLDAPWRPGDIEQRDGRVFRQKNENEEAYKFVYVTRGSFDSRLWDILDRKQKFINQVMNGEDVGNEIEDTGEVTLSAAEVKAVASDNPLIYEQVALEKEISKLQSLQQAHRAGVSRAQEKMATDRRNIALLERLIASGQADISNRKDTYSSDEVFSIRIGNQTFKDKKDAGTALVAAAQAKAKEGDYTDVGKFAGFTLRVVKTSEGVKGMLSGAGNYEFKTYPLNPTYGINHLISVVEGIDERLAYWNKNLSEAKSDLETQKQIAAEPFDQAEKLKQKRTRYNEVMDILNPPKEEQHLDTDGGDTVQYQKRSDRPERRRALVKGEMINEFHDALSAAEWHEFYDKIIDGKYNPELFEDNDLATVTVGDKILTVKMMPNGEFSVTHVWKHGITMMPPTDVIKELKDNYATSNYTDAEIESWISRLVGYDGEKLFFPYNRHSGQFDGYAQQSAAGSQNAYGMSGRSGSDGENLLEISAGESDGGDTAQNQQRTHALTDREVLTLAASQVKVSDLNDAEKNALDIFQQRLAKLEALQEERAQQGRLYKEQQFGAKVDRDEAAKTLNRMHTLDSQIQKASAEVLSVEEKVVLKRVLQKARKVVEQQQWTKDQETLKRWRDRRNNADAIKKYRDRLRGDVDELTNWVLHPDNKNVVKHIPDALKNTVLPFLSSINFMSKRSLAGGNATVADKAFMEQLRRLAKVMEGTVDVDEMYSNYNDLPPDFMQTLRSFMDSAQEIVDNNSGEFIINQMTAEELQKLSKVVRTLKKFIMQMNRFHVNAMFKHVYDAGNDSIHFMSLLKPAQNTGTVSQFLLWQQMRPAYAFERFGQGGMAIYDGLRRGQATLAFNTQKITEFSEKAYTAAEVRAWEKQVKTIRLNSDSYVKMRVSQIMSLYELSKRPQALGHILGEGIRVATFKDGKQKISDIGHTLTPNELDTIINQLTPRQKEVADNLQQFMQKQGGEWGNYVTVARFGEKQFGEENYFPINSDGRHLSVDADEKPGAASLYALLNMGFTKQTQEKAKNRIILYSIFDVFANHMASMAQYNAFALPVVDALKWFNYQQINIDEDGNKFIMGSVREQMDRAFGVPEESRPGSGRQGYAQNFVINIIKAFNGTEAQGVPTDAIGVEAVHRYNVAQVAYNLRVVAQQPLAITRAALLVDYRSIIKGMKLSPAAIKKNIAEMQKYSGIAAWKALGFYDVNISRGLTDIIKHDTSAIDRINDFGMTGAELADTVTWAGIWSACKEEVIRKQHLTPKSEGFYEAVTKLFEDVIYKTQVVDSVLTKNEYLRSKGLFARLTGSFMSEPTATASMLVDAYDKYQMDIQRGMTLQQAWKKNGRNIVRTVYVYAIGAAVLAAVQAVADAFRDDDDYQEFIEKWLEAFGGNLVDELMPFNKLPLISDFYELAKELLSIVGVDTYGNPPQSVFMQWYDSLVKGVEIIYGRITGEEDRYTWYGGAYKLLQALSGLTGLPMAAATREIVTAWNNTVGSMAPSLKVKTYDPGDEAAIRFAYEDGYLTSREARMELQRKGVVENEPDAYWKLKSWKAGDGFSKYDTIFDAVRNGGDFNAAMEELTSNGHERKDVLSEVKGKIHEWYTKGEISKQQAIAMLTKYFDMDSEDITSDVNRWSSKVVTGIAYEDIKEEFLSGNITAQRAIDMRVLYGGQTKEDATKDVTKWRSEVEIGIPYEDLYDAYEDGKIGSADLVEAYIIYGQREDYMKIKETYETVAKPSGMSANKFYDTYFVMNDIEGERDANGELISRTGTRDARWAYIDSLDIPSEQKDALHLAFYKASSLDDAPWH